MLGPARISARRQWPRIAAPAARATAREGAGVEPPRRRHFPGKGSRAARPGSWAGARERQARSSPSLASAPPWPLPRPFRRSRRRVRAAARSRRPKPAPARSVDLLRRLGRAGRRSPGTGVGRFDAGLNKLVWLRAKARQKVGFARKRSCFTPSASIPNFCRVPWKLGRYAENADRPGDRRGLRENKSAAVATQYPPDAATLPIETTTECFLDSRLEQGLADTLGREDRAVRSVHAHHQGLDALAADAVLRSPSRSCRRPRFPPPAFAIDDHARDRHDPDRTGRLPAHLSRKHRMASGIRWYATAPLLSALPPSSARRASNWCYGRRHGPPGRAPKRGLGHVAARGRNRAVHVA